MKKLILSLSIVVVGASVCFAGPKSAPAKLGKDKMVTPTEELFRANEFDIGMFAAVAIGRVDYTTHPYYNGKRTPNVNVNDYDHTVWGGGVEADYFFTRYLGLGVEGTWLAGSDVISSVAGSVIARYPIEYGTWGLAPYGFIGGGGQFDSQNAGFGHFGVGTEVRLKCHWGVFTDARWVIHDSNINYALIRLGVRYNF
ncbi:MAG: hypothetical protein WCH43_02035 [Verrucomicrobiota bacterium]